MKIFNVIQESNCNGEISVNVTPCKTLKRAKEVMDDEINTLISESKPYKGLYLDNIKEKDHEALYYVERTETSIFISLNYDDYYEDIKIEEKEVLE